jgi:FkbM family methyltransferase
MPVGVLERFRRDAGRVKQWLAPKAETAAWKHACRLAEQTPRYAPGQVQLADYTIAYADLLTLCPQWHDIFVRETLRFACASASPRIIDAGANVGLASLYFKRLYPGARITAFEADPALYDLLVSNLARNRAASVDAISAALWTSNGFVTFRCEGADSGAIADVAGALDAVERLVPARRLRDLLAEPVDFLKLDIEGAELPVLQDCETALGSVRAMVIDVHELDVARRSLPAVLALLERAGFRYALDSLEPLDWRGAAPAPRSPFPRAALCWTLLVHAWREPHA